MRFRLCCRCLNATYRGRHNLLTRFGVEQGVQSVFVDCEDLHADVGLFIGGGSIKFLHLFETEGFVHPDAGEIGPAAGGARRGR